MDLEERMNMLIKSSEIRMEDRYDQLNKDLWDFKGKLDIIEKNKNKINYIFIPVIILFGIITLKWKKN